ncbi:hypothetical protein [Terasakiella pusilla]|uniref:hypothetical protein n=1 Tax=Terasakiella pusilla TaxID=64973 RepID=UPI003AA7BD59
MGLSMYAASRRGTLYRECFQEIECFLKDTSYRGLEWLILELDLKSVFNTFRLSTYIGKKIDTGSTNYRLFCLDIEQEWLQENLPEVIPVWVQSSPQGYLKPLYEELDCLNDNGLEIDYIQIRIALIEEGIGYCRIL